jgi:hypothetical protein
LVLGGAHVLELPPKMAYEPALYAEVTSSLYRLFGSVGAFIQVFALLAAAFLSFRVRGRPGFRLTLLGTAVIESSPASVPETYARLRPRWEYGHVAAFAAWLFGFACLLASLLVGTPDGQRSARS